MPFRNGHHARGAAQPGIAVDRFAREIVGILKPFCAAHSRQLNAKPLDGTLASLFRPIRSNNAILFRDRTTILVALL